MNEREFATTFEVVVGRTATCELAYVWRADDVEQTGTRFPLKRALVTGERGEFVEITEGMHLQVDVDPANPTRITLARVIVHGRRSPTLELGSFSPSSATRVASMRPESHQVAKLGAMIRPRRRNGSMTIRSRRCDTRREEAK